MPISYTWKLIKCILQCVPKHNKMFTFLHTPVVDFGSHLLSTEETASGVLDPVLDSPLHAPTEKFPMQSYQMMKGMEH